MRRRTLLKSLGAAFVARPIARLAIGDAQAAALDQQSAPPPAASAAPPDLTPTQIATLAAIADVALPASIGAPARKSAVDDFVSWIENYKAGADTGHSYGSSVLQRPTATSPATRYPAQFAALDQAAVAAGAASFVALDAAGRRKIVEAALTTPTPVTRLGARPTGANLVGDLVGFYFNSSAANDACYERAIGRDSCRSLDGSEQAPAPLQRTQDALRQAQDAALRQAQGVARPSRTLGKARGPR